MSPKTLSVSAIEYGCVIDHIPVGQATKILQVLELHGTDYQMTVGLNLKRGCGGKKDIIKIEGRQFIAGELQQMAIFATGATVNEIEKFNVTKKFTLALPDEAVSIIACPNSNCISNIEPVTSHFKLQSVGKQVKFHCQYCESAFTKSTIEKML